MKKVLASALAIATLLVTLMCSFPLSISAADSYVVNGVTLPLENYPNGGTSYGQGQCWAFAQMVYKKLWSNTAFTSYRGTADDMLKDVAVGSSRAITAENTKKFITAAQLGAVIRITDDINGNDSQGTEMHSMILVHKDANGLTIYDSLSSGIRLKYFTWSNFASTFSKYKYFKYIKWASTPSNISYSSTNPDDYSFPTRSLYYTSPTMTGSDVAWVQAVLKKLGFSITIDGKYGPTTRDVIKQFQTKYGLEVDGKCGPVTRTKLQSLWNSMKCTHTYTNACDTTCNKCGAVRTVGGHSYSNACDAGCNICGATRTPAAHMYSNACDTTCNVCGAVRTVSSHSYSSKITTTATCGADGVMTYTCSSCGHSYTEVIPATGKHTYDNDCDATCNICGAIREVGAHVYDDEYDADCNVCGAEREVPEKPVDPIVPDLPADAPAFVVESVTAREGEEFTVAIRTQRNSGIVSLKLNVTYDADVLELISLEEQDFANVVFSPLTKNPFIVNWADAISPNNTTDGVVVLATFRVKEGAPLGKTEISLTYNPEDVYDENYDNVAFRVENGSVEIVDYLPGDINGDGKVNNKDLGLFQRFLSGWDVQVEEKASDVNGDGKVNNKDLGLFQRFLSGWDVDLG